MNRVRAIIIKNNKVLVIKRSKKELVYFVFPGGGVEQLEHFYFCNIVSGELGTGNGREYDVNSGYEGIYRIKWLDIDDLVNHDLRPSEVVLKLLDNFGY